MDEVYFLAEPLEILSSPPILERLCDHTALYKVHIGVSFPGDESS
jgi:hypothetical protein